MSSPKASPLRKHPLGYLEKALDFQSAADTLYEAIKCPDNKRPLRDPTYFLYLHAVELALKACLLSRDLEIPEGGQDPHDVEALFDRCRTAKLLGLNDRYYNLHNLIVMLGEGNRWHRYRYPGPNNQRPMPDLDWVQETVVQLIAAVRPHVAEWVTKNNSPAPPTIRAALGKPTHFKLPVPLKRVAE